MPSDAKSVQNWLAAPTGTVAGLLAYSQRLAEASRELRRWLAEPWAEAVRIANIRDDAVVIYCANAAALTLLRYRSGDILAFLRQRYGLVCHRVETRVRPLPFGSGLQSKPMD